MSDPGPPMTDPRRTPADRLTRLYVLTLGLLAVLALVSHLLVERTLVVNRDASVIRIASGHRTMSEHLSMAALALETSTDRTEVERRAADLREAVRAWSRWLQDVRRNASTRVHAELAQIVPPAEAMLVVASRLRAAVRDGVVGEAERAAIHRNVSELMAHEARVLSVVDEVILAAAAETQARLAKVSRIEQGLLAAKLLVLLLAAVLVFRPAAKVIRTQFREQQELTAKAVEARRFAEELTVTVAQSEERARALVENGSDIITVVGPDARIRYESPSAHRILGYSADEMLGPGFAKHIHPEDTAAAARLFASCIRKPAVPHEACVRFRHKNGTWRTLEVVARNAIDDPAIGGIIVNSRDVTAREQAKEALHRIKSDFLANMSHEVRGPMTALLGATRLALDGAVGHEQRQYLELVSRSADAVLSVINDIFDFSEIEAGRLTLEPRRFRLREELEGTFAPAAARAQAKGLELIRDLAADVPDALVGDPHRLRQVLASLLGNAVKFTERGEIVVRVAVDSRTEQEVVLLWSVTDTGVGVPVEQQEAIFDPFGPHDPSSGRRGGTGLGLAIASELVTMMDGRIWVESQPEQGSRFHFTTRFRIQPGVAEETSASPATAAAPVGRGRILVAEDNPGNRMVAVRLLERQGFTVVAVENGREALDALALDFFDLVLMDVAMPEMDGIEATTAIRRIERTTGHHLPVVALTAFACAGDRARCLEAGMDDYLAKPFKREELMAVIGRLVPKTDAAAVLASVERSAATRVDAVAEVRTARPGRAGGVEPA